MLSLLLRRKNTAAGTVKIITLLKFHYSFVACIILISYLYYTIILSNNHACTIRAGFLLGGTVGHLSTLEDPGNKINNRSYHYQVMCFGIDSIVKQGQNAQKCAFY